MFWDKLTGDKPVQPKFPLNLRIGAIVSLDAVEAFRFEGADLNLTLPAEELVLSLVESFTVFDLHIYRGLAKSGDKIYMLQLNCNAKDEINDYNLFELLQEVRPQSEADWETWLGEGGLIGGGDVNAPNGKSYLRDWGSGEYSPPVEVSGLEFDDLKLPPANVTHKMMLYARNLGAEREYLLLSCDERDSQPLIRAWVGIDVLASSLKVY